MLGRCRRRVLIIDAGKPRNAASRALHGFLSRDGTPPADLLRAGREQLRPYASVELRSGTAFAARVAGGRFEVRLVGGGSAASRRLVFATGVVDQLPAVEGAEALYGRGVVHCPYCDGWEVRDQPVAVYGKGAKGLGLAGTLLAWTADVVLCTDGPARLPRQERLRLERHGVVVRKERLERLEGDGRLERLVFAGGETLPRAALFFNTQQGQRSRLPARSAARSTLRARW